MWKLLLFEVVIILLAVGVWLGAPLIGIKSVVWRILIILALVLPPMIFVLVKFLMARKAAKGLEDGMKEQGLAQQESARPDRQEEILVLNENFEQAIEALKKSRIGGGSTSPLYVLPWYMIIGPPAAGKSTALLRSGLNFPYSSGGQKSIKGIGGTRNCDWWFSDQAIMLDTAGRYTMEDEDRDEWLAFIRLLKRYRKQRPLNGLIVCISISELLTASDDELEHTAANIRDRLDQVLAELEMTIPIYVLFSKCDLLSGFVEFFGDLKKSSRKQVFGFTVPVTTRDTDIEGLFNEEFEILSETLHKRVVHRLAGAKKHLRSNVFQFPLQFAQSRHALAAFLKRLFIHNPYQESPGLRGVYFCSGTQEGRPLNKLVAMMSSSLGLRETAAQGAQEKSTKKSYFLHDVFTKVLFPDRHLAGVTASGKARRFRIRTAIFAAGLLLAAGILATGISTFANNRALVDTSLVTAKGSRLRDARDPKKVTDSLQALDQLGAHYELLETYQKEGPPWSYRFGFYSGGHLIELCQRLFAKRMWQLFADNTAMELEASLYDVTTSTWGKTEKEAARSYDMLKAYLMVTNTKRLKVDFALPVLLAEWKKRLHPEVSSHEELLSRNVKRYLLLLKDGKANWIERDESLIKQVRRALLKKDVEYKRIVGTLESTMVPFSLRDALQGRLQTVLKSSYQVPGVYTREGWEKKIKKRISTQAASGVQIEPWVLGEDEDADPAELLRNRYFSAYNEAWGSFFKGLTLEEPTSAQHALQILEKLTGSPSIYELLFVSVAHNTDFSPKIDGEKADRIANMAGGKMRKRIKMAQRAGLDKVAKDKLGDRQLNAVEQEWRSVYKLVYPPPGIDGKPQVSGLKQYTQRLEKVREELTNFLSSQDNPDSTQLDQALTEARRVTKLILEDLPSRQRSVIGPMFNAPLQGVDLNANNEEAKIVSGRFSSGVCAPFGKKLAGKYPFAKSAEDALMQDVTEAFSRQGTIWQYYGSNLKEKLELRGDRYEVLGGKKSVSPGIVAFINKAWAVTQALFPQGAQAPTFKFDVRPHPAIVAEGSGYMISEISLEVDAAAKIYRNGPRDWWSFTWPGSGRKGARLLVRGADGLQEQIQTKGDWAFMRLIDRARVQKRGSWYLVEWSLKRGKIRVQMDFKPHRTDNPLLLRSSVLRGGLGCR